jgi:CBS domain-containing protein
VLPNFGVPLKETPMTINRLLKGIDREIMSVLPNTPVQIAINILARDDTSALVVSIDDHLVLGILSNSDIVKYLDANGDLPIALMVSDIMTHDVISCEASEKVERLEQLMTEHQVRQRVSDLLCMSNSVHASSTKEHEGNDDYEGSIRRAA